MMAYSPELQNKILSFYEKYYKSCGLSDAKERAQRRLKEEELEERRMKRLQGILNVRFSQGQKHFVFGAGTGGLAVVLARQFGCEVSGIEPCGEAFLIIQAKLREKGIDSGEIKKEFGEALSFADNQFDFVHCFTVLEHVQNVEKSISEMLRVTKPGGCVYINTPNYRFPEERHYKIFFPTFLPKFLGRFYLFLLQRPVKFIKSINFITEKQLNRILAKQKGIYWFRIYGPLKKEGRGVKAKFLNFFKFNLFVYPTQEIVVRKLN